MINQRKLFVLSSVHHHFQHLNQLLLSIKSFQHHHQLHVKLLSNNIHHCHLNLKMLSSNGGYLYHHVNDELSTNVYPLLLILNQLHPSLFNMVNHVFVFIENLSTYLVRKLAINKHLLIPMLINWYNNSVSINNIKPMYILSLSQLNHT